MPISDSDGGKLYTLAHDEAKDVAALRAEGHADADFVRALLDAVRNYAVNSDGGEDERESAEKTEQDESEMRSGHGIFNQMLHGDDVEDGLIFVDGGYRVANGRSEAGRIDGGTKDQIHTC